MSKQKKKKLGLHLKTSHGGWPNGPNNSWIGNKPVNDIIYDYLYDMGLIKDVPHGKLSESKVKNLIRQSLKEAIAAGSTPGEAIAKRPNTGDEVQIFESKFNDLITGLIFDEAVSIIGSMPKLKMLFDSVDEKVQKDSDNAIQTLIQAMSLLDTFVPIPSAST